MLTNSYPVTLLDQSRESDAPNEKQNLSLNNLSTIPVEEAALV